MAELSTATEIALVDISGAEYVPLREDSTPGLLRLTLARLRSWLISDDAYAPDWSGVTDKAPSKNAVFDKIEALAAAVPSGYTDEQARDAVMAMLTASGLLTEVENDAGDIDTLAVTEASTAEMWAGTSSAKAVTPKKIFDMAAPVAVAYGATITLDGDTGLNWEIGALTGPLTLANPTNFKAGQSGIIWLSQDATGGRVITYGSKWKFAGGAGTSGVLSTAASAVDAISYIVKTNGDIHCSLSKAFS